jgi:hypothetical protein
MVTERLPEGKTMAKPCLRLVRPAIYLDGGKRLLPQTAYRFERALVVETDLGLPAAHFSQDLQLGRVSE